MTTLSSGIIAMTVRFQAVRVYSPIPVAIRAKFLSTIDERVTVVLRAIILPILLAFDVYLQQKIGVRAVSLLFGECL